ncbi:hypothetical protein [Ktedonobacter racemifer]|uniref:hypothetical protein n=1 Tax=Ktedonobacter racemifer TaxID=363277 RepID=UPI0012FC35FE|nr:hypothetical protein [Ktedonobacter racemifer]
MKTLLANGEMGKEEANARYRLLCTRRIIFLKTFLMNETSAGQCDSEPDRRISYDYFAWRRSDAAPVTLAGYSRKRLCLDQQSTCPRYASWSERMLPIREHV